MGGERELSGEPGAVLGGEASTAFGGGSGLGKVGTDAADDGSGVETPAEMAATVAGADEDRTGEQPNP